MTNPTNWPNPEQSGVPMFPERDGWHLLRVFGGTTIERWSANAQAFDNHYDPRYAIYDCACLTPTQIAELLAGERERCANIFQAKAEGKRKILPDLQKEKNALKAVQQDITYLEKCAEEIRSLGAAP